MTLGCQCQSFSKLLYLILLTVKKKQQNKIQGKKADCDLHVLNAQTQSENKRNEIIVEWLHKIHLSAISHHFHRSFDYTDMSSVKKPGSSLHLSMSPTLTADGGHHPPLLLSLLSHLYFIQKHYHPLSSPSPSCSALLLHYLFTTGVDCSHPEFHNLIGAM